MNEAKQTLQPQVAFSNHIHVNIGFLGNEYQK